MPAVNAQIDNGVVQFVQYVARASGEDERK